MMLLPMDKIIANDGSNRDDVGIESGKAVSDNLYKQKTDNLV